MKEIFLSIGPWIILALAGVSVVQFLALRYASQKVKDLKEEKKNLLATLSRTEELLQEKQAQIEVIIHNRKEAEEEKRETDHLDDIRDFADKLNEL